MAASNQLATEIGERAVGAIGVVGDGHQSVAFKADQWAPPEVLAEAMPLNGAALSRRVGLATWFLTCYSA